MAKRPQWAANKNHGRFLKFAVTTERSMHQDLTMKDSCAPKKVAHLDTLVFAGVCIKKAAACLKTQNMHSAASPKVMTRRS